MEPKTFEGKNIEEAIQLACDKLQVTRDQIHVDVVDPGKRGFLLFGRKNAKIKVSMLLDVLSDFQDDGDNFETNTLWNNDEKVIDLIHRMLEDLFESSKISAHITRKISNDQIIFEIKTDKKYKGLIIGKKGKTINSLQNICQVILAHELSNRYFVILDIDNYREARTRQIREWLEQAVSIVRSSGQSYQFSPMVAVERQIIINYIKAVSDISFRVRGTHPRKYIEISKKLIG